MARCALASLTQCPWHCCSSAPRSARSSRCTYTGPCTCTYMVVYMVWTAPACRLSRRCIHSPTRPRTVRTVVCCRQQEQQQRSSHQRRQSVYDPVTPLLMPIHSRSSRDCNSPHRHPILACRPQIPLGYFHDVPGQATRSTRPARSAWTQCCKAVVPSRCRYYTAYTSTSIVLLI